VGVALVCLVTGLTALYVPNIARRPPGAVPDTTLWVKAEYEAPLCVAPLDTMGDIELLYAWRLYPGRKEGLELPGGTREDCGDRLLHHRPYCTDTPVCPGCPVYPVYLVYQVYPGRMYQVYQVYPVYKMYPVYPLHQMYRVYPGQVYPVYPGRVYQVYPAGGASAREPVSG
jgi:hypothetical protein